MEQTAAHRGVGCRRLKGETGERLWGVGRTSNVDIMIRTHFIHWDRPAATGGGLRARQGPLGESAPQALRAPQGRRGVPAQPVPLAPQERAAPALQARPVPREQRGVPVLQAPQARVAGLRAQQAPRERQGVAALPALPVPQARQGSLVPQAQQALLAQQVKRDPPALRGMSRTMCLRPM